MAKRKAPRKSTKGYQYKGIARHIPEKHHDRVIVYGGIFAIVLLLLISGY